MALVEDCTSRQEQRYEGAAEPCPGSPGEKRTMRLGLYHVYEGSTVVRRAACAVCSRKAFIAPVNIWQWPKRRVLTVSRV